MASGLPVITSRVAGAADLIIDGVNGLLLSSPSDVSDLATKIELLLSNAGLRKTMGERAREATGNLSGGQATEKTLNQERGVI